MTRKLQDYITESAAWINSPAVGDDFAINIREECLVESHIVDLVEDGVVLAADDKMMQILESYGMLENDSQESVARAITHRILNQRLDLLSKYGPDKVSDAIDDVAAFVGSVEEIGSSDISGWVRQVERTLSSGIDEQGVAEAAAEEGTGSNSRALRIAEKIWAKYGSPKNEDRIRPDDLIDLVDAAAGGRTYFFSNQIEAVPGVKTIMASINHGKFYDRAKFDKGVAILLKAAPKLRFGESVEQGVAEGLQELRRIQELAGTVNEADPASQRYKTTIARTQYALLQKLASAARIRGDNISITNRPEITYNDREAVKSLLSVLHPSTPEGYEVIDRIVKGDTFEPSEKPKIKQVFDDLLSHPVHGPFHAGAQNAGAQQGGSQQDPDWEGFSQGLQQGFSQAFRPGAGAAAGARAPGATPPPAPGTMANPIWQPPKDITPQMPRLPMMRMREGVESDINKQALMEDAQTLQRIQELAGMPMAIMPPATMLPVSEGGVKNWIDDLYYKFNETYSVPADISDDDYLEAVEEFLRDEGVDPDKIEDVGELFIDQRDQDEDADHDYANRLDAEQYDDENTMEDAMDEAKYQGREVPLGKPMAGDVKKSKVYVKGPKGNVVKVNFGDKKMRIKKSNPKRRKSFRARHNCANPGPRWKARYWSCRAW
jgi:hypothetical protein